MGTRDGNRYLVTDDELRHFQREGFVHLSAVLHEDELVELDAVYDAFMRGEIAVLGKDLNDMVTGEHGGDPAAYAIFNVMLPRRYHAAWQGNVFERIGHGIARAWRTTCACIGRRWTKSCAGAASAIRCGCSTARIRRWHP